jgi:hypothetical protein
MRTGSRQMGMSSIGLVSMAMMSAALPNSLAALNSVHPGISKWDGTTEQGPSSCVG